MLFKDGQVVSTVVPAKAGQKTKYNMYYDRREPVAKIPSHRVLAIRRGSKEGVLTSSIQGDDAAATATFWPEFGCARSGIPFAARSWRRRRATATSGSCGL